MLKNRNELNLLYERKRTELAGEMSTIKKIQSEMEKHNYLPGAVASLITNTPVDYISDMEMLWLCDAIYNVNKDKRFKLDIWFTSNEIQSWKNEELEKISNNIYPVIFENILEVSNDQWLCVVDTNKIIELYKKQLINYNRNTQRQLTEKTINNEVVYKITVNKTKIKEIKEELKKNFFIPNVITLNLSTDNPDVDFDINYKKNELVLLNGQFDIIDGYHRFRAITELANEDNNFSTKFSLRIVNFSEKKAKRFIVQEDKQTPMKKEYTKSITTNNFTDLICGRINEDSECELYGKFNHFETQTYFAFVNAINILYGNITRSEISKVSHNIVQAINIFADNGIKFDFVNNIMCVVLSTIPDMDKIKLDCIKEVKYDKKRFANKVVTKTMLNYCEKVLKGGC